MLEQRGSHLAGVVLAASLVLTAGCLDSADKADLEKARAQASTLAENKAVVQKYFELLNAHDTTYIQTFAADAKIYIPSTVAKPATPAEDLAASQGNWQGFPDLKFTVHDVAAEGDMVFTRISASGVQKAAWNGIPSAGKTVTLGSIVLFRIANGKIVEQREEYDALGLMMQLGMELRPGKGK